MMRRAASSQVRATKRHYRCMQCQNTPHRTARLASISSAAELYSLKPDRCRSHSTNLVNTKARSLEHSTKRHMAAEMPATGVMAKRSSKSQAATESSSEASSKMRHATESTPTTTATTAAAVAASAAAAAAVAAVELNSKPLYPLPVQRSRVNLNSHDDKDPFTKFFELSKIRLQLENYPLADGGNVDEQLPYSNGLRKAGRNSIATTGYDDGSRMTYESILLQQNRLHPGLNPWKGNDYRRRSTYDNQVSAIYIM